LLFAVLYLSAPYYVDLGDVCQYFKHNFLISCIGQELHQIFLLIRCKKKPEKVIAITPDRDILHPLFAS